MSRPKKREPRTVTPNNLPPLSGVVGTQPGALEQARELWRSEGRAEMNAATEAVLTELRADAAGLERSAFLLEESATGAAAIELTMATTMLRSLAAGIRLATERMPGQAPF